MQEITYNSQGQHIIACPHLGLEPDQSVYWIDGCRNYFKLPGAPVGKYIYLAVCKACYGVMLDEMATWIYNRVKEDERHQQPCPHKDAQVVRREVILHDTAVVGLIQIWRCEDCRSEYATLVTDEASMEMAKALSIATKVHINGGG